MCLSITTSNGQKKGRDRERKKGRREQKKVTKKERNETLFYNDLESEWSETDELL